MNGAKLTLDQEWLTRRAGRELRPGRKPKIGPPVAGLHWCGGCRDWLHPRWFLRWDDYRRGKVIPPQCRPCRSHNAHNTRIKREFGIDFEEYQRLFKLQGGVCAICLAQPVTARLAIDHDHTSGKIRGLLCSRCNNELLGAAHDSIAILRRAVEYLEAPPAQNHTVTLGAVTA